MKGHTLRALPLALGLAAAPLAFAQSGACCTHLGGPVACPSGLPGGSASVEFVTGGTRWVTPSGQSVFVAATTFPTCAPAAPAPAPPPPASTAPPASAPPPPVSPPPPTTPSIPPPPPVARPPEPRHPPRTPPTVSMPASPPVLVAPASPPVDEGTTVDKTIGRMGTLLREREPRGLASAPGNTSCRPGQEIGRPGSRAARATESCNCDGPPGVLKNEAPGAGGAPPAAVGLQVEVHVNPNWTVLDKPIRGRLGDDAGRVFGVSRYGQVAGSDGGCQIVKGNCPGQCVTLAYAWLHLDFTVNISYVRGMRHKAAHEAVHARQMAQAIRTALAQLAPMPGFGCGNQAAMERQLDGCKRQMLREARTATTRAMAAWQAERDGYQGSKRAYRSDPMEVEAFAEEEKGERAAFPPEVNPPPEFTPR